MVRLISITSRNKCETILSTNLRSVSVSFDGYDLQGMTMFNFLASKGTVVGSGCDRARDERIPEVDTAAQGCRAPQCIEARVEKGGRRLLQYFHVVVGI